MESDVGLALRACSTSASWSTLDAVATKVSKRLRRPVGAVELEKLMLSVGDDALWRYGVWRHSFGAPYMPLVLVHAPFGRALQAGTTGCSCGQVRASRCAKDMRRYLGSHDYNAGRHASTASVRAKVRCTGQRVLSGGPVARRTFTVGAEASPSQAWRLASHVTYAYS